MVGITDAKIEKGTMEELDGVCDKYLNIIDSEEADISFTDLKLIKFVLDNTSRNENAGQRGKSEQ